MPISEQELVEFIELYRQEFGKQLSTDCAAEIIARLTNLYELIMRPLPPGVEEEIRRRAAVQPSSQTPLPASSS
jgi:hypothetical protein